MYVIMSVPSFFVYYCTGPFTSKKEAQAYMNEHNISGNTHQIVELIKPKQQ